MAEEIMRAEEALERAKVPEEKDTDEEIKNEEDEVCKNDHPVFDAVKGCDGDPEKIRNFFEIDNVDLDIQDSAGMTPLMHACWKNQPKVVKFLINLVITSPLSISQQMVGFLSWPL